VARRLTSVALAGALLLAGCGSSHKLTADQQAAKNALQGYLTALAHRDYAGACVRLTHRAKVKIARRSRAPTLNLNLAGCPKQLAALVGKVPGQQRGMVLEVLMSATVQSVRINGRKAIATVRATFRGRAQAQPIELQYLGGAWLVNASPNPANPGA
jgi:hypothetical protein